MFIFFKAKLKIFKIFIIKQTREKYYNVLLIKWNDKIKDILKNDNYNCMEIESAEEYVTLMENFPCELDISLKSNDANDEISTKRFFKRLPYSACVPKLFVSIKEFVDNCAKFAEGLNSR